MTSLSQLGGGLRLAPPSSVNLRVDIVGVDGRRVVRLAGRLLGGDAAMFEQICNAEPLPLRIDLQDLLSADDAGVAALLQQKQRGARFTRVPAYIRLRLAMAAKLAGHAPARQRRRQSGSEPPAPFSKRRVR